MKVFFVSFTVISGLFLWILFSTGSVGMEAIQQGETTYLKAFGGVAIAIGAMSFWLSMLTHFFKNKSINNRVIWGFSLLFFHVIAAVAYLILVIAKKRLEKLLP